MTNPVLNALAHSLLSGDQSLEQIVARATQTLGRPWRWLRPVARRYLAFFEDQARPRCRDVVEFLLADDYFTEVWSRQGYQIKLATWLPGPSQMQPVPAAAEWDIPALETVGDLARWLHLEPSEVDWFADLKALTRKRCNQQLRHYHYRVVTKQSGTLRLIEAPKPRLKQLQRNILAGILDRIPAHPAAHGFRRGRSIASFASPHTGQRVVLRMDLQDFFPSLAGPRVQAFFRTAGYPETVADLLGGICTNSTPRDAWPAAGQVDPRYLFELRDLYLRPHLPQGAPTSPALANLLSYRLDCRLAGLAHSVGAGYTRYADDLAFSGGEAFDRAVERFSLHVAAILREEGFAAHHRKTRIMRQGVRQQLAGLVTNQRVNVRRADFDRLKAILTNCIRHGLESQNREQRPEFRAYLAGHVAFVESVHAEHGRRLRMMLNRVQ